MEQMKGFNSLSKLVNRFALILDLHSFQERLLDACYGTYCCHWGRVYLCLFLFHFYGHEWIEFLIALWGA